MVADLVLDRWAPIQEYNKTASVLLQATISNIPSGALLDSMLQCSSEVRIIGYAELNKNRTRQAWCFSVDERSRLPESIQLTQNLEFWRMRLEASYRSQCCYIQNKVAIVDLNTVQYILGVLPCPTIFYSHGSIYHPQNRTTNAHSSLQVACFWTVDAFLAHSQLT